MCVCVRACACVEIFCASPVGSRTKFFLQSKIVKVGATNETSETKSTESRIEKITLIDISPSLFELSFGRCDTSARSSSAETTTGGDLTLTRICPEFFSLSLSGRLE